MPAFDYRLALFGVSILLLVSVYFAYKLQSVPPPKTQISRLVFDYAGSVFYCDSGLYYLPWGSPLALTLLPCTKT